MQIAILGAGALGRILGVRLATRENVGVDFIVRPERLGGGALKIERVHGDPDQVEAPSYLNAIPAHADAVLVCLRADQLGDELVALLNAGPAVPVVVATPMLPRTCEHLRAALGSARLTAMMPSVTGYTNAENVTRYWVSRASPTLLDEPRPPATAISALATALTAAGIDTRLELGVHEITGATTIAFLPLLLGLDAAGSLDGLLADRALLDLTFGAFGEARALAAKCGRIAPWALPLFRFLGPYTARMGIALGRRRSPEALAFVSDRFGRSARAQNAWLAAEVLALAADKGLPCEELTALAARLVS